MEENKNVVSAVNTDDTLTNETESSFDFKTILSMLILNWQWFVVSLFICICGALIYLRYTSPIYQVSAKMLIKDEDNSPSGRSGQMLSNMQDLGFMSNSNGIDNEVEILQSHILAREAVKDLKLYTEYRMEGKVKDQLIYKTQPLNVDLDPQSLQRLDKTIGMLTMTISKDGQNYKVVGECVSILNKKPKSFETSFSSLPSTLNTPAGILTFTRNSSVVESMKDRAMKVKIMSPMSVATRYVSSMTVEPTSKTTSIALITLKDFDEDRASDFLTQLAICYNRQANADKNEIAVKTEEFINGRLEKINNELGTTEGALESYKKRNNLTQLKLDATETLAQTSQYSTKLSEANSQIELLDYLREFVDNPANKYQIVPSNVGLADASSTGLIAKFNQSVLDRNRLLRSASESAPQVLTLTSTLDELQQSIRTALNQARRSADITRQGIQSQYSLYQNKVASTPAQERILTQIGRQQEVKSGLYLMLLQKREENSISLAATADKGKLIDEPSFEGKVSPKGSIILLIALVLGTGIPMLIIYLLQLMRYKIEGHEDVAKLTTLPIVADVAVASEEAKDSAGIVVHANTNNQIDLPLYANQYSVYAYR